MTVKYTYKSDCCEHEYIEQRGADEPMFFPTCNKCYQGDYILIDEEVISDAIERQGATYDIVAIDQPDEVDLTEGTN